MATYIKKDFASPNGPILLLSAKGSTTASIAQANGVKDFSGNGNHGQAYGTTTVNASDDEFVFDGSTASKIDVTNSSFLSAINGKSAYSLSITASCADKPYPRTGGFISNSSTGYLFGFIFITTIYIAFHDRMSSSSEGIKQLSIDISNLPAEAVSTNDYYAVTATVDYTNGIAVLYVNGVEVSRSTNWFKGTKANVTALRLGQSSANSSCTYSGSIKHIRVYDRVLSAAEVKYLYNGFQPSIIMGQTIPSGAILDLSARGLTTAGIAQANGVVDRSGNGNHGQAYNGVAVVNDDEMGSCFSFSDSSETLYNISGSLTDISDSMTLSLLYKRTGVRSGYNQLLLSETKNTDTELTYNLRICLFIQTTQNVDIVGVAMYNNGDNDPLLCNINTTLGKVTSDVHLYTATYNASTSTISLYIDGVLATTKTRTVQDFTVGYYRIGFHSKNYSPLGILTDVKIYPRALTASEVQQLADASLKKITNIKSGSSDVRQIFSNGEMIYAKTNDYSLNL